MSCQLHAHTLLTLSSSFGSRGLGFLYGANPGTTALAFQDNRQTTGSDPMVMQMMQMQTQMCQQMMKMLAGHASAFGTPPPQAGHQDDFNPDLGCSFKIFGDSSTPKSGRVDARSPASSASLSSPEGSTEALPARSQSQIEDWRPEERTSMESQRHQGSEVDAQIAGCLGDLSAAPKTRVLKRRPAATPSVLKVRPAAAVVKRTSPKAGARLSYALERTRSNWQARTPYGNKSFTFGAGKLYSKKNDAEAACRKWMEQLCKEHGLPAFPNNANALVL